MRFRLICIVAFFFDDRGHACRKHILSSNIIQYQFLNKGISHILSILLFRSKSHRDPVIEHSLVSMVNGNGKIWTRSHSFIAQYITTTLHCLIFLFQIFLSKKLFFEGIQESPSIAIMYFLKWCYSISRSKVVPQF